MIACRSKGTSVRVRIRCVETGQVWNTKREWLDYMRLEKSVSYNRCRHALMYDRELNGLNYEQI